jgi:hypothetical protein
MTNPTRIEINCTTGEESVVELTDAEIAQRESDAIAAAAQQEEASGRRRVGMLDLAGRLYDE